VLRHQVEVPLAGLDPGETECCDQNREESFQPENMERDSSDGLEGTELEKHDAWRISR